MTTIKLFFLVHKNNENNDIWALFSTAYAQHLSLYSAYNIKGTVSRDIIFFGRSKHCVSTFCVCADGFKAFTEILLRIPFSVIGLCSHWPLICRREMRKNWIVTGGFLQDFTETQVASCNHFNVKISALGSLGQSKLWVWFFHQLRNKKFWKLSSHVQKVPSIIISLLKKYLSRDIIPLRSQMNFSCCILVSFFLFPCQRRVWVMLGLGSLSSFLMDILSSL